MPAGAPQCRGDRCGPGRSELRGDRRGGEPATRAESTNAEAAGGCGSFDIETMPIDVQEAADFQRAVPQTLLARADEIVDQRSFLLRCVSPLLAHSFRANAAIQFGILRLQC